jgi:hypothetical protein
VTASDNLSKSQVPVLFHGSDHSFGPGAVITPEHSRNHDGVYATDREDLAGTHGRHTYRVEPVDPTDFAKDEITSSDRWTDYSSDIHGFRVLEHRSTRPY